MANAEKDPLLGTRIREYEVLDIIGRGGMGAVYKARHVYLDEERAIKLIRTGLSEKTAFVDRFIREAKLLTKLRHPNLVQLYEFGTLEELNTFFMVLELVRGESVLQRINRNQTIPVEEAISITRQAALGLELAHQKGVIHRDISPDNLLIVNDEEKKELVKVIDFGIAKPTVEETHRYTLENMFLGKLEYSSPEQCGFHEEGEVIDHRSDIYSLTVTLYHMLSGKLPFYSPTPQGYMMKHASEIPKPVSSHLPEGSLPPGLDEVILRALSKRRNDRQSSMRELIQDLDAVSSRESSATASTKMVPAPSEFKAGDLFAKRYRIVEQLGKGGMGTVYRATDTMLGVTVALKVMNPALSDNPKALDRFKREVILARQVAHRNVCRIYDFGENHGIHYVSMELLEGRTLADILRREGPYTADRGIPILTQILYALQEAHSAGIVHRDLKPQNIIVDSKGRATITDFGISTSSGVARLTQTGALIGTPRYMAPEQFGERSIDHRTDIYSIAIIMFEMFTGALPYEANTPASMMYAHLNALPHKPSELAPDIPPQLEQIILKGLEKDPNNRYQDVDSLLEALHPFIRTGRRDSKDMTWTKRGDMTFSGGSKNVEGDLEAADLTSKPSVPAAQTVPPVSTSPPSAVATALIVQEEVNAVPELIKPVNIPPQPKPQPKEPSKPSAVDPSEPVQPQLKKVRTWDAPIPGSDKPKSLPMGAIAGGAAALLLIVAGIWFFSRGKSSTEIASQPSAPVQSTNQVPAKPSASEPAEKQKAVPEPAATPAADDTKQLQIDTSPAAASIILDGKDTGLKTPASIPFKPGQSHQLELQLAGYETLKRSVDGNGSANILLQLKPLPGTLQYKGKFPVSIYSDNKLLLNASDGSALSLPPGAYTLTLINTQKTYIHDVQKIEVKPQETTTIAAPEMGSFSITANPSNCKIFIDGVFIDSPPIFDMPLQVGNHAIRVAWEKQAKEKTLNITIAAGQSKTLRAITDSDTTDVIDQTAN